MNPSIHLVFLLLAVSLTATFVKAHDNSFYAEEDKNNGTDIHLCTKKCSKKNYVCDIEIGKCVDRDEMTEGRRCLDHWDCRDDHICYEGRCTFFVGRFN